MTHNSKKNRIIFIDLMRAFAVLMMVQGHTVDVLLSNDYRNIDSPFFAGWLFMRGMTAPIFMFTAGTVFTYLFRLVDEPFKNNPRVIKGIKRFLLLVGLGYLLRYPTPTIIDFSEVTKEGWDIFFAVDVLQLIGFGILFLVICAFIAEKTKLPDHIVFSVIVVSFFLFFPVFDKINWIEIFPEPIAGYFYTGTGSIFPLFPWAGYVVCGGVLGSYLAKNPMVFRTAGFSLKLSVMGIILILLSFFSYPFENYFYGKNIADNEYIDVILLRTGFVLLLNALISYISISIDYIPRIIILIGRNTLLIYAVHLIILYGSAWNPGLSQLFEKSFSVWKTIGTTLIMISLMVAMVIVINKLKIRN
ncbi:MAG: heparan-alpha-glucosaminide N-acetyltransferase domain-containing protein, partial [Ignavibacteria bacterium]|nr:heparan-alpha-glucosaminide N-acetyltransferase domain-containing protein [Ignavibacteria bacterium]